jgi:proteic killer suppression protein
MERFADQGSQDVFNRIDSKASRRAISTTARKKAERKLDQVVSAKVLGELAAVPNNDLKKHNEGGRFHGYYSVEINDQYRVMFRWTDAGAMAIEIADYHGHGKR